MKLREFFHLLGLKPAPIRYGSEIVTVELAGNGMVEYARWLHPRARNLPPPSAGHVSHLRRYLRPGDVAIDIGAHVGDSTLPIALAVGPSGAVLALEPNPFVFPTLELLASLNRGRTVILPLPLAAAREDGPVVMYFGEQGFCNGGINEGISRWVHGGAYRLTATGRHLPSLLAESYPDLLPRLRFIKIDAEGHDLAILETLEDLVRERQPLLQVEFFTERKAPPGYRARLLDRLTGHGYRVYRVEERSGDWVQEEIDPGNLHRHKTFDAFCIPREVG